MRWVNSRCFICSNSAKEWIIETPSCFPKRCICEFSVCVRADRLMLVPKYEFRTWWQHIRQVIIAPDDLMLRHSAYLIKHFFCKWRIVHGLQLSIFADSACLSVSEFVDSVRRVADSEEEVLIRVLFHSFHAVLIERDAFAHVCPFIKQPQYVFIFFPLWWPNNGFCPMASHTFSAGI